MSGHRSPNCPQISFEEAILKGRKVYEKEQTHDAPKAAVAEDLGYSGLNGRALSMIGALRQYGILEGNSEALRVTEDAVAFYELDEGTERTEAMERMIFRPPFFDALRQTFPGTPPSEATLKHHLIKEGFLPRAAEDVVRVYRANIALVVGAPKRVNAEVEQEEILLTQPLLPPPPTMTIPKADSGILSLSYLLSPDTKAELIIRGPVGPDELEMLRGQLELTIRALSGKKLKEV